MFLSDSSGSGDGFHARLTSFSSHAKSTNHKAAKGKPSKSHQSTKPPTSHQPTMLHNSSWAERHNQKKDLVNRVPPKPKKRHRKISNTEGIENSFTTVRKHKKTMVGTYKRSEKKRKKKGRRTAKQESLNLGHLKIALELIDFNKNTVPIVNSTTTGKNQSYP